MDATPKVVLDTTVLVSAFLTSKGVAAEVLERAVSDCILVVSDEILAETLRKLLTKRKIRKAYRYEDADARDYVDHLAALASAIVHDPISVPRVVRDPEDDMIIACAATVAAEFLITRDKDLLSLGTYGKTQIVTPRQFLDAFRKQ